MWRAWGRRRNGRDSQVAGVNITSLMDAMTIILIFLLYHFSSQDQNIRLEKGVELPKSSSEKPFKWAINVTLAKNRLLVEDDFVCPIKEGRFIGVGNDPEKIAPLYDRLVNLKDVEKYRQVERDATEPVVIFHADKQHRFETINAVMKTAAMAGYPNFRFAVLKR
ncbi:MAG: biopolymer transporter ExbD [bacterium]